jgi:hypothetical protein
MKYDEALRLRKKWMEKGNPLCDHSKIEQRFLGPYAGDYACTICGETFISLEEDSTGKE